MLVEAKRVLALLAVTVLMVAVLAMPASAQPIFQGGLVNVNVSGNTVQLPVSVAANVCDVEVQVLVADLEDDGEANCTARSNARANR